MTSEVFENAVRYRHSYDSAKGEPLTWLIGIARRCVGNAIASRSIAPGELFDVDSETDIESEALERLTLDAALALLSQRDRDLLALRYAVDLRPREIAALVEMSPNATTVALHRALSRLRLILEGQDDPEATIGSPHQDSEAAGEASEPL